jgi:curli production assembly/transport component CsgG
MVSVYNFRDQTGQYRQQPAVSSFSTAVTQGATSILIQALKHSRWFTPVEREGLQNLLTERKIIRATLKKQNKNPDNFLPPLSFAQIMIEGGIIGYDHDTVTGGDGIRYFGVGISEQYRMDQVTIYLRAVDIRTGQIVHSVSTTKSILSREVSAGVFRYVSFKRLLEAEAGYTTNEPLQICVQQAIEKAVLSLIIDGILDNKWALKNPEDIESPVISSYIKDKDERQISIN